MKFLSLILALICGAAFADDMVASNGADSVRLTQQPCPPAILNLIAPLYQPHVKAAFATINGKQYTACWLATQNSVSLQYEDGDAGSIPLSELRRVPAI